jgi:copper oxidase (laccase) domain-containing protein
LFSFLALVNFEKFYYAPRVVELFSFLEPLRAAGFPVDFVARVPGVAGGYDKAEGLRELESRHCAAVEGLGYRWDQLWRAEQVHGNQIAPIDRAGPGEFIAGVDGLMTQRSDAVLGIYVADCGLIWLADHESGAVALVHSGRKGTEAGILSHAVAEMKRAYGTQPENLLAVLGPCIRPPHYEVDFAARIARNAEEAGVGDFIDCGLCTGSDLEAFYSYRMEQGATGRMLGLLGCRR